MSVPLSRNAASHFRRDRQVQIQTSLRRDFRRHHFDEHCAVHSAERILESVLGLGRGRRRHVQQNQIREYEDSAAAADDCAIQNDQTRTRIVEQAESEEIFTFEEFSLKNVRRWTELA